MRFLFEFAPRAPVLVVRVPQTNTAVSNCQHPSHLDLFFTHRTLCTASQHLCALIIGTKNKADERGKDSSQYSTAPAETCNKALDMLEKIKLE
ncbi:uncharacterized [Tachysurus ichikawai]